REVNQTITSSLTEEEVFEKICKNLVEKIGLRFVWVGFPDWKTLLIKPKYYYGYEAGYLKKIKVSISAEVPEGRGPVGTALRENRVTIISDIRTDPRFYLWREEALKREYLSVAGIPIYKDGNPYCVLGLYAKEPNFFTDETLGLLEELKGDIEFALKRIEEIRNNVIISQALLKSPAAVFILDEEGKIVFCNETVLRGCGRSFNEIVGQSIEMFGFKLSDGSDFYPVFLKFVSQEGDKFEDVLFCSIKKIYMEMKIYPIEIGGGVRRFIFLGRDVSEERELIAKLEKVMLEDPLTGLLNVEGFERRVNKLLGEVVEGFLVVIDISNFTYINRTYSFEVGNRVLKEIGKVLQGIFPGSKDLIARLGADEFGCFLRKEDYGDVRGLIDRLGLVKEIRVEVDGQEIVVATNVGIGYYPGDGKSVRELLEKASLALSEAKRGGAGEFRFFASHMELKAQEIISLDQLLEKALENRWFVFFYQPYFRAEDLRLAGLEALVRIKVDGKIYNPSEFIDYLERSWFLPKFEEWMFEEIEEKARRFRVPISVNVSGRSFSRRGFVERFLNKFSGEDLSLEITERVFIEDVGYASDVIKRLRGRGIRVFIDDFGTGYCALSYLRELAVDVIKVDRSFIQGVVEKKRDRDLVEVIVLLARRLGIESLAEGVETEEQLDIVKKLGFNYVQGFLLEKPLPEEELLSKYPEILSKDSQKT
ncbi:MAG: hypothetical protein PWP33_1474, partial [Thermodesulfobacterium sp.]|nr:hypothetical protein [Thermodesulfobacterium sp.]